MRLVTQVVQKLLIPIGARILISVPAEVSAVHPLVPDWWDVGHSLPS